MPDRLLWEVQTFAANLTSEQLADIHTTMRGMLGSRFADEIVAEWEHELEEEDD